MGLQLLEREKRVLADVENPEPQFKGYEYLLEKYLKPRPAPTSSVRWPKKRSAPRR